MYSRVTERRFILLFDRKRRFRERALLLVILMRSLRGIFFWGERDSKFDSISLLIWSKFFPLFFLVGLDLRICTRRIERPGDFCEHTADATNSSSVRSYEGIVYMRGRLIRYADIAWRRVYTIIELII